MLLHQLLLGGAGGARGAGAAGPELLWIQAGVYGLLSAASLPLGACLGTIFSPVPGPLVAGMMAFGAGALLFAVTVELYGHALAELAKHRDATGVAEILVTVGCALVGALIYLYLNEALEVYMSERVEPEEETLSVHSDPEKGSSGTEAHPRGRGVSKEKTRQRGSKEKLRFAFRNLHHPHGRRSSYRRTSLSEARHLLGTHSPSPRKVRLGATITALASERPNEIDDANSLRVGLAVFLGVLSDGVPEAILLGFLAAQHHLSLSLVAALFIANFPEAFSSASLMAEAHVAPWKTIGMWSFLCCLTGALCAAACLLLQTMSPDGTLSLTMVFVVSAVEGLAGGAMIACISAVMLPDAYQRSMKHSPVLSSGFLCTAGFLASVAMKVLGGDVN